MYFYVRKEERDMFLEYIIYAVALGIIYLIWGRSGAEGRRKRKITIVIFTFAFSFILCALIESGTKFEIGNPNLKGQEQVDEEISYESTEDTYFAVEADADKENFGESLKDFISDCDATSYLSGTKDYPPQNLIDGDKKTSWQEGVDGFGVGESFRIYFSDAVPVRHFAISNGNHSSKEAYQKNCRVKMFTVIDEQGRAAQFTLEDTTKMQYFDLVGCEGTSSLTFVIEEVYEGDKYEDTCVAEMYFYQ